LVDEATGTTLRPETEKVVILIHGYNPPVIGTDDMYSDGEFAVLKAALKSTLHGSGWTLALLHWEQSASTALPHTAAELAEDIGTSISGTLGNLANLRRVHLVAHSAGSWAARSAARNVIAGRGDSVNVQLTLLDPFIPGAINPFHSFSTQKMSDIDNVAQANSGNPYLLENYYAWDTAFNSTYLQVLQLNLPDLFTQGTQEVFQWRPSDLNLRVDWLDVPLNPGVTTYYDFHAGPVRFYSDTVVYANLPVPEQLTTFVPLSEVGWQRSMFFCEPSFITQPTSKSVLAGIPVTFRADAGQRGLQSTPPSISIRWDIKPPGGVWQNSGNLGSTLTLGSVLASQSGTKVRAVATLNGLSETSTEATLTVIDSTVPSPPSAPQALISTSSSSTQINLRWTDTASNESGFRIERRLLPSGFWNQIATRGGNTATFSDTGLPANTSYDYRVSAYNSYGTSSWSNIANARTGSAPTPTHLLSVNAVDLTVLQSLSVNVYSWEGTSTDFRSNTTSFSRSAQSGKQITTSAPATLNGGKIFQYWLRDGSSRIYNTVATITMDGQHDLIAIYGNTPPANRTLQSISIQGPSSVDERRAATYSARATYTDGTTGTVPASWSENSSYASISASGVLDTASVISDKSVTVSASATVSGVTKSDTKSVTIRNTDTKPTYTLDLNAVNGHISASPDLNSYEEGAEVRLSAHPDDGYIRTHWSGDVSGDTQTVYIKMTRDKSVTAHFAEDTRTGDIRVNILPQQAAVEGGGFKVAGQGSALNNWQPAGTLISNRKAGEHTISFKSIPGWVTPEQQRVSVLGGQTVQFSGTYREILGAVQVVITPPEAGVAGARWRIGGGAWQESGTTLQDIPAGPFSIEYSAVAGWTAPPTEAVTVERGGVASRTGNYTPPAGLPIISSVSPRTGPIAGGTEVTISGVNFAPGSMVTFGGVPAASVTVDSSSRIRAVSPARSSYGTVALQVNSGGSLATVSNGYSYLEPLGSNMELVGQLGGSFLSVEVAGNLAYVGEGTSFVVLDIANPSAPVERGRIVLPGLVYGIAVANGKAYVASGSCGLYVLDVSTPTSPTIVGLFDTPGISTGIALDGNRALLADSAAGLQILDISSPTAPTLISSLDTPGSGARIAIGTIGARKIAFVADGVAGVRVIEFTVPSSPVEIAVLPTSDVVVGIRDVRFDGGRLYSLGVGTGIQIFDASNPNQPSLLGSYTNTTASTLDVGNGRVYAAGSSLRILDPTNPANITSLSLLSLGGTPTRVRVVGGNLFVPLARAGFKVVSVTNSAAPSILSSMKGIGRVNGVAISGSVALAGNDDGGVDTVDVSDPARPVALGRVGEDRVSHLAISGNTAVLVNFGSELVRLVDISQPSVPVLRSTYSAVVGWDVAFRGSKAVVAGGTLASPGMPLLDTLNITNPSSPQRENLHQVSTVSSYVSGIAFSGSWGFVTRPNIGLDVVSYANAASPVVTGFVPMSGWLHGCAASTDGNYIYAAEYEAGVRVVDSSNKASPLITATINPSPSEAPSVNGVKVSGDWLVVTDASQVYLYDISAPATPVKVAYYDLPRVSSYGSKIDVAGDLIYIASGDGGLTILKVNDLQKPTLSITAPTSNSSFQTTESTLPISGTASDNIGVTVVTWQNERGGGGTASGTTSWSVPSVPLVAGINRITITAVDAQGNTGSDIIEVTANLPDTSPPVVIINGPQPEPEFVTESESIVLSGPVSDDRLVTEVTWVDQSGASGSAILESGAWSVPGLALAVGPNVITVTARDAAGNSSSDMVSILRSVPDTADPVVTIGFPTTEASYHTRSSTVNLSGEASDDTGISSMSWINHRGGAGTPEGGTTWAANDIPLLPGVNFITVVATDASGKTGEDTLSVTYTPYDSDADGLADDWEMLHFSALDVAGLETDTGNTGYTDFLKQALGIDPNNHDPEALPRVVTDGQAGGVGPVFKYRRPIAPGPLQYTIGVSEDLGAWDWSESQIEQVGVPTPTGDGFTEEVTLRLLGEPGSQPVAGFFRIEVSTLPVEGE
jgi:hypothetical protein